MMNSIGRAPLSRRFVQAVKLDRRRRYELAMAVQIHPCTFSGYLTRGIRVRRDDPRIAALAKLLGVPPSMAFEADSADDENDRVIDEICAAIESLSKVSQ